MSRVRRAPALSIISGFAVLAVLLAGCGTDPVVPSGAEITLPPAHARWDYQLGSARAVSDDVTVVSRDREASPVPGRYNVCYLNAFQTQDSEASAWRGKPSRWSLVLKDAKARAVVDSGWGEWLLDTRTPAKRRALVTLVGRWIDRCARDGFDAVEPDNLDSFARSRGLVSRSDNLALAAMLIDRAHDDGLAVAQKNWPELGAKGPALGFDFVVAEECGQYRECRAYTEAYGSRVLAVEYTGAGFARACHRVGDKVSVVRRDRELTASGVRRYC